MCHGFVNVSGGVELLNGGQFNGRTVIASDRNKDESIKIKELVDTSPNLAKGLRSSIQYEYCPPVSTAQFTAPSSGPVRNLVPQSMIGSHRADDGYLQQLHECMDSYSSVPIAGYSPPAPTAFAGPNGAACNTVADYYNYGGAYRSSQVSGTPDNYWSASLPYLDHTAWSNSDFANTAPQPADPSSHVVTERRKILVRDLPFRATPEQVIAWVRKKMGPFAGKISTIEVPRGRSGPEIRGHAYVAFRSSSSAKEAVRIMDQSTFKGRQVSARMTTEGVALMDDGDPRPKKLVDADKDKGPKKSRRSKDKVEGAIRSSSSRSGQRSSSDKDAKSGKVGKMEKTEKSEKDDKDRKYSGPLVVDGTTKQKFSRQ